MTNEVNELQLIQMHREWWKDSYGTVPNSQASVVAAAFARHVINVLAQPKEAND